MIKSKAKYSLKTTSELRRHAEERLQTKAPEMKIKRPEETTELLFHELQVHQIELDMQNSELRQTREEVEIALEKYIDLYDFAPVGYCNLDRNGVIRSVNLTATSLLGIERSQLLGSRFEQLITNENKLLFNDFIGKVFTRQGNKESCEIRLSTEKYPELYARIEAFACMLSQECRVAVIDITAHKRADAALIEKKLELENINHSLEMRIDQAVDDLRQKDQMLILQDRRAIMGEMINNIAHQWRQPLNLLGLYIQELPFAYDAGEFSRDFLVRNSGKGMEVIQQMSQTIDDFMNFFKPDKEAVTFCTNQAVMHTLSLIEKSFQEQQIEIDIHSEEAPMANGYPNEYAQVLLNILMNARDALVGYKVDDALISIRAFTEMNRSVVTITDNAGGIAEEIIQKIFDPYFTTKGPDNGTGIGLFMSKAIIEKNMGGKLTVRNIGNGAEFRIEV